jgi:Na+/proline symporter
MKARYGKPAHVIFVILALLVNLCVISTLLVAGVTTIQSYTVGASDEFCVMIIAVLFGSYSFIGMWYIECLSANIY